MTPQPLALLEPLPWWEKPWKDRHPVLLLEGSAGGGKSVLMLQKVHAALLRWPNANALITRKTAESMSRSTRLMMWRMIMGGDRSGIKERKRDGFFEYPNGSLCFWAGMNDDNARERIKSIGERGGLDLVAMEEGTEFDEEDFNLLGSRMRSTAMPFRQIIIATNPDSPQHWIYRRLILGKEAHVYRSNARDNPHNPEDYHGFLGRLTGVDHERLAKGLWVKATGQIYDTWSEDGNVTEAADYTPGAGPVLWGVDDGYSGTIDKTTGLYTANSHPRVFLLCQERPDGTICVFDEHHAILKLEDEHVRDVLALPYPEPDYAVVDKSAAVLKAVIRQQQIPTLNGAPEVESSIKELRRALAPDINGRRRVLVHPRCKLLRAEMAAYSRDTNERVVKAYDHAVDALRYLMWRVRHNYD